MEYVACFVVILLPQAVSIPFLVRRIEKVMMGAGQETGVDSSPSSREVQRSVLPGCVWFCLLGTLALVSVACAPTGKEGNPSTPGFLEPIAEAMIAVIQQLAGLTHDYGLAIVLFAVLMKLVLYYPTQQQYRSMKEMQRLNPELEKLKEKYRDDPQKLQEEQLALFQKHNVNPLGGCLPMLVQMPILIAIWQAILSNQRLFESAYFLWIRPGPLQFRFPDLLASSLAGRDLPMILFYGLTMYLSQRLTPASTGQASSQRLLALGMTAFFTWLMWAYRWPCALILYWSVYSLLTIVQQALIMRGGEDDGPTQAGARVV